MRNIFLSEGFFAGFLTVHKKRKIKLEQPKNDWNDEDAYAVLFICILGKIILKQTNFTDVLL